MEGWILNKEFETILTSLKRWQNGGMKTLENGTELICHVPHVAPQAWLHTVYARLSDEKIDEIKKEIGVELPVDFIEFLKCANGINIFSDSLSIWGLRTSYARTGDAAIQPYDLVALNQEKKGKIPTDWIVFGSYSWDGSEMLYDIKSSNSKVYRCENGSKKILQEWETLWAWLSSEVERLSKLFDEKGIEYDENTPTIPGK
jgi:hypothetical protein